MKEHEKQIIKMVFDHLDNLYLISKKQIKLWKSDGLPINMLKVLTEKSKIKTKSEVNKEFNEKWNNLMDVLLNTCKKQSDLMGVNSIPLAFFNKCINTIKSSYKWGVIAETGSLN